jgi:UDPglucose 6-dehydrogenase
LRDAPALDIAQRLIDRGAKVRAHDPVALAHARQQCADLPMCFVDSIGALVEEADALVLVTEWPQYQNLPWTSLARSMRIPLILDGRNFLEREPLERAGFRYLAMGR